MSSGDSAFEPFLEYSGRSPSPTPSLSSAGSAVRIVEPNQLAEQNLVPYVEPNMSRDESNEHRPVSVIQHPTLIKTDIPPIFKPEDMPYLKKRYGFPENAVLSAPVDKERGDSVRDGWVCFYEIAFKLGLRLPFHHIISMVLKYFNLAPGQLMPNEWHYLLGLIVLSEQLRQHINMPIFLHFFCLKPGEEGRYAFYARKQTKLLSGAPTSDKGWKDRYFFIKKEGPNLLSICAALNQSARLSINTKQNESIDILRAAEKNLNLLLTAKSFRSVGYWPSQKQAREASPSQPQAESISKGIPLLFIEASYTHILEGCIRLLYGEPTDPLWASFPTIDMGKMKVAPPTAEQLAEKERRRKEKKAARKVSELGPSKDSEPTPGGTIIVKPKDLVVAATAKRSPSVVAERDEWQTRGLVWPQKKKIVYRKGVEDAYLRAQKKMILKFKAGQTSWRTPEPSEDEGDDGETSEISSTESEPKLDHQPKDPSTVQEKSPSPTRDSFDEAMEAARTNTPGASSNAKEVASASQPNQKEAQ
ncbi:hypothetical protein FNV43_RR16964 [Rhamnella rubrinervis]|uniref:Transposase (putative) gypsy type domain-containing protein n=1 Tax=Rhamnella rubrinervis TaxID=2594499 RepID=A0A8K0GZW7_9ROSA|nr:hypothetical protein FNV43_RR16964 [Rhamnella rubrinervis]